MKKLFLTLGLLGTFGLSFAQDPHFSQPEMAPSMLNPALAGANYDIQANVAYRNQWSSVGYAFQTMYASADMRLVTDARQPKGYFGVGVAFMNDVAGGARVTNNSIAINLAYHIILDKGHTLGLGANTGFGFNSISGTNGRWASQFDGVQYNMLIPSGESFQAATYSFFDLGAGLLYSFKKKEYYMTKNDSRQVNIGFSAYHLTRPQHSFIDKSVARMPMRFVGFVNVSYGLDNTNLLIEPGVYYMQQGRARDILLGSDVRYILRDKSQRTTAYDISTFGLGLYYRNFDALFIRASYEYYGFKLSLGYDLNISTLATASRGLGGFELALRWTIDDPFVQTRIKK
jgi:type IX secretion system PorP/SprF family membrane protein